MSYGNGRMGRRQAVTTDAPGRDKVLGPLRETQLGPEGYPVEGSAVRGSGGPGVGVSESMRNGPGGIPPGPLRPIRVLSRRLLQLE